MRWLFSEKPKATTITDRGPKYLNRFEVEYEDGSREFFDDFHDAFFKVTGENPKETVYA